MNSLSKKLIKTTSVSLAIISLFTLGSCSLFNKSLTKDEALEHCYTVSKSYTDCFKGDDTLESLYKFPVKKIDYSKKTTIKQKGVDEATEKKESFKLTKSGKASTLRFDITITSDEEKENGSFFVKDGKYYLDSNGIEEITEDDYSTATLFYYLFPLFDMSESEETNIIGTSDIKEGFTNATKGFSDIVINAEVDYSRTKVTLKKTGIFKDTYYLSEYSKTDKAVDEETTTTALTTIKLSY